VALTVNGIVPRLDISLAIAEEMPDLTQFAAHRVLPPISVMVSTAPIPKVLRRNKVERLFKAKYGTFPQSALTVDLAGTYNCQENGFDELLDQKDKEILGGGRGEDSARWFAWIKAAQLVLIAREYALQQQLNTTTFPSGYNGAGAATWAGGSDKPITDVSNAAESVRKRCGYRANTLLISGGAWVKLLQSAQVQSALRTVLGYTSTAGIAFFQLTKAVAMILGLGDGGDVIVSNAVYNTADESQTATLSSVLSDTQALVFYRADPNDLVTPGLGRMFIWEQGYNGYYAQPGISVAQNPLAGLICEQLVDWNRNLEICRAREFIDMLILNKEAGYLLTGI
jgi:hypothetical protein